MSSMCDCAYKSQNKSKKSFEMILQKQCWLTNSNEQKVKNGSVCGFLYFTITFVCFVCFILFCVLEQSTEQHLMVLVCLSFTFTIFCLALVHFITAFQVQCKAYYCLLLLDSVRQYQLQTFENRKMNDCCSSFVTFCEIPQFIILYEYVL